MVIRLPFRGKKRLDTTTSYQVRYNILFFINFSTVFTNDNHNNHVFFSVIQTNRTQSVEVSHTETNHSGRNCRPQPLKRFQIFRQTETRPVYFKFFSHYVKMTIYKTVVSDKNINNQIAISKTRTSEFI